MSVGLNVWHIKHGLHCVLVVGYCKNIVEVLNLKDERFILWNRLLKLHNASPIKRHFVILKGR